MAANALESLDKIRSLSVEMNRPLDMAEADVLIAIVEWCRGNKTVARSRLRAVLAAMKPYGFVRVVANEGKAVLPILTAIIKKLSKEADIGAGKKTGNEADSGNSFGPSVGTGIGAGIVAGIGAGGIGVNTGVDTGAGDGSCNAAGDAVGDGDEVASLLRFAKEVYMAAYEQSRRYKGLTHGSKSMAVIKLSEKQRLILSLLSKGHSNAEIMDITGYSINTVRSYTKIVYRKLDVNNAMDAVLKARQLDLL